ncbi:DNA-binding protein [Cupriavidus necator]|uniref:DNA-binding protein n=1 Tax=Cupriavidus necator TaxID=106590 RepID=A0A2P1DV23_CUPNE|nr:DNA-binding protein [Cupriavidus necator]
MVEPILDMHLPSTAYLDAHDLAAILKVSPATILRRARRQPHTLPAPAHLGPNFPLRWRRTDVASWLGEGASSPGSTCSSDDAAALCD